jgi:lactoylglutathione lyase
MRRSLLFVLSKTCLMVFLTAGMLSGYTADAQQPHVDHTTIFVTDLQRATEFYTTVMLFDTIPEPFKDGKHTWFRIGEHTQLHVVSGAKMDIPHDINIHLAFSVADLSVFTRHLDDLHIKYGNWAQASTQPQVRPDGVKQVYLQDPDGFWIEINDDRF